MIKKNVFFLGILFISISPLLASTPYQGKLIDAYSTVDHQMQDFEAIILLMDKAGVKKTILCAQGGGKGHANRIIKKQAAFARQYPNQIVPLLKIMNRAYRNNNINMMLKKMERELYITDWKGVGKLAVYQKDGTLYNDIMFKPLAVMLSDSRIEVHVEHARKNKWPLILQVPFARLPEANRDQYMKDLETLLSSNTDLNVVLPHLGQLKFSEVSGLLGRHKNLYFDLSRTYPAYIEDESYTQIFYLDPNKIEGLGERSTNELASGYSLSPEWREVFSEYSDRFLVAYFNVGELDWEEGFYMENTAWFRKALEELEPAAADSIAHGNAERLWHLQ